MGAFQRFLYGKEIYGRNHRHTLDMMYELGWDKMLLGVLVEAEDLMRLALAGEEHLAGPDQPCAAGILKILHGLGLTTFRQNKFKEAEDVYRRLLPQCQEKLLGLDHNDTLITLGQVAMTNFMEEKLEEAEGLYRRLLESRENFLGPDHHDTLATLGTFALTIFKQEKFEEAEGLYISSNVKRLLGPEHDTL